VKDATTGRGVPGVTLKFTSGPNLGKTVRAHATRRFPFCALYGARCTLHGNNRLTTG
jgi:hypothetical protein